MKTEKRKTFAKTWEFVFIRLAIEMARRRHMIKAKAMWTAGLWLCTASNAGAVPRRGSDVGTSPLLEVPHG